MATAGKRLKELNFEFKPKIFKANGQFTFLEPDNLTHLYKKGFFENHCTLTLYYSLSVR